MERNWTGCCASCLYHNSCEGVRINFRRLPLVYIEGSIRATLGSDVQNGLQGVDLGSPVTRIRFGQFIPNELAGQGLGVPVIALMENYKKYFVAFGPAAT